MVSLSTIELRESTVGVTEDTKEEEEVLKIESDVSDAREGGKLPSGKEDDNDVEN
jgi:hypothetical protein